MASINIRNYTKILLAIDQINCILWYVEIEFAHTNVRFNASDISYTHLASKELVAVEHHECPSAEEKHQPHEDIPESPSLQNASEQMNNSRAIPIIYRSNNNRVLNIKLQKIEIDFHKYRTDLILGQEYKEDADASKHEEQHGEEKAKGANQHPLMYHSRNEEHHEHRKKLGVLPIAVGLINIMISKYTMPQRKHPQLKYFIQENYSSKYNPDATHISSM